MTTALVCAGAALAALGAVRFVRAMRKAGRTLDTIIEQGRQRELARRLAPYVAGSNVRVLREDDAA